MAISPGRTKLLTGWCIPRAAYADFLDHPLRAGRKMPMGEGTATAYRMGRSGGHGNREHHDGQFLQHISPPGFLVPTKAMMAGPTRPCVGDWHVACVWHMTAITSHWPRLIIDPSTPPGNCYGQA